MGGSTTSYGYDAVGRRTSTGSTTLSWDQRDRLLSYVSGNSYSYDGSGIRVSKTVSGVGEAFVWDAADGLPLVLQDGSTLYVTGPGGLPLEQVTGSTALYCQQDQLGSTRALTDSAGAIAASYSYDAYGNLTNQTGSVSNPFLYTGQYRDSETGLYYLRARYYDPATAEFLSRDPKVAKSWDPYAYAAGDPLNAADPSGLDFLGDLFGALGAAFGAFNSFSNGVAAAYGNFTASESVVCPPAGHFLNGLASGFNLDMHESNDPWFKAGQIVGMGLFHCHPDDGSRRSPR